MENIIEAITVPELEEQCHLSDQMLRRYLRSGRIVGVRVLGEWLIPVGEAERVKRVWPRREVAHAR